MADLIMRRTLAGFEPTSEEDWETLRHIKQGELCQVKVTKPRNLEHHRLYWSLCQLVADNHPTLHDRIPVDQTIKQMIGHVDQYRVEVPGQGVLVVAVPKSISFSAMDQTAFEEFFKRAIGAVSELLSTAPDVIRTELARRLT